MRIALQRVVNRLRNVVEILRAADDSPFDVEAGTAHERDQRVVDFRHAAAERRRGEVDDALALKWRGKAADLFHQPARRNRRVIRERLVAGIDELQHSPEITSAS